MLHHRASRSGLRSGAHIAVGLLGAAPAILLLGAAAPAFAQSFDPSTRDDVRESREISRDRGSDRKAAGLMASPKPWTLDLSVGGGITGNAEQAVEDTYGAGYLTPGARLTYSRQFKTWKLAAYGKVDADFFSTHADDLDEARLEGRVSLSRPLERLGEDGGMAFRYRALAGYDRGFGDHNYTVHRLSGEVSGVARDFDYQLVVEQHLSDIAESRRTRVTAVGAYTWPTADESTGVTLEQVLSFSDYQGGANRGRNDVLSTTTLSMDREVGRWSIGLALSVTHDFSNREDRRFTAVEVGPTFSRAF